jgi:hypothetical protein
VERSVVLIGQGGDLPATELEIITVTEAARTAINDLTGEVRGAGFNGLRGRRSTCHPAACGDRLKPAQMPPPMLELVRSRPVRRR